MRYCHVFYLLLAAAVTGAGAGSYTYTALDATGADPGTTVAQGINDSHQVVGSYTVTQSCGTGTCAIPYGFLYSAGSFSSLSYPGSQGTRATGINDSGQVVGFYNATTASAASGFLYSGGSYATLNFPNSYSTAPSGINSSGEVVGGVQPTSTTQSGFYYNGTTFTTVTYPGATATTLISINDSGVMTGLAEIGGVESCFVGTPGSFALINTSSYSGYTCTSAAVNDSGQLALTLKGGGSSLLALLDTSGTFTTISFPSSITTTAAGLNNNAEIAGTETTLSGGLVVQSHGYLATLAGAVSLSSISPNSATAGGAQFTLTVTGSGFVSGTTVLWNGSALTTTYGSSTSLTALVPSNLITTQGTASVTVQLPGGGAISNPETFTINAGSSLSLTSLSPSSAQAGGAAFTLTVNGTGFINGSSVIEWNGSPLSTIFTSSFQLSATIPQSLIATQGTANVTVVNSGTTTSNGLTFTIYNPSSLSLSSLSPNSATAGGAAFTLTVYGAAFNSNAVVLWNGTQLTTYYVSSNEVTATVTVGLIASQGTASVTVQNPGVGTSNPLTFTINPASGFAITSLSPNSVAVGSGTFTLTVYGNGFVNGGAVLWNGTSLPTTFYNSSEETATVASTLINSTGTVYISVENPNASITATVPFTIYNPSVLSITSLSPNSATAGGSQFTLYVYGSAFASNAVVLWNGSALSTSWVSATEVTAIVPASLIATQGAASVTVQNPSVGTSTAAVFTINAPTGFTISSLSPSTVGAGSAAFNMTVNGSGFVNGGSVLWNGVALTTTYESSSQLIAIVPSNLVSTQGYASVSVENPGGATTGTLTFTVGSPNSLVLSTLVPSSTAAGGASFVLTLTGSGFLSGATVLWNGSALSTSYLSTGELTATVPSNLIVSAGAVSVSVENPGGAISSPITFSITSGGSSAVITSLSPSSTTAGVNTFILTVNGSGFVNGAVVQWNSSNLTTNYVSPTQLTAVIPSNLVTTQGASGITVLNPGGSPSSAVVFTINPGSSGGGGGTSVPSLSSLAPASTTAGGSGFTLTVNGTNFVSGSTVEWNNSGLTTTYVSSSQLTASVPANLIAAQGTASITVLNPGSITSGALTFTINASQATVLSFTTTSPLTGGSVGVSYSLTFAATGGTAPYQGFSLISGTLPPGISLSLGQLTGTPTSAGTFTFTMQVTDGAGLTATKQFTLTITGGVTTLPSNGITNSASYATGSVSPGEIITIFGSFPGPGTVVGLQLVNGLVSTNLDGAQAFFDGIAAPVIYATAGQMSVVVPYEVSGKTSTQIQVAYQGQLSNSVAEPVSTTMPGIFTSNASGQGQGAILNQDGSVNSASNPAAPGSYIAVYATGEGQTSPGGTDGKPGASPPPQPLAQPVTATVGGIAATVQYAGGVYGLVAGVLQVNVQVPQGVTPGSVPITVTVGGQGTQSGVTVAVQ